MVHPSFNMSRFLLRSLGNRPDSCAQGHSATCSNILVRMRAVFFACILLVTTPAAQDRPLPDYDAFVAQVKRHLSTDEERQSGYMFIERLTDQRLDASGQPYDESVKVFEVYPGLPGEDRYRRLVEENGKPVPPDALARRDHDRRKAVEAYVRKESTDSGRQEYSRRLERKRQQYRSAIDDLFRIYDIRMEGRERIAGHDTIVATLMPKPGVQPQSDDGKIMRHFKARAWISESDAELVRVDIEALDDLSFGWGILGRLHKGATATYQRRKVNNESWLPERVTWTGSGRVFLLKQLRRRGVAEFSGYRKFSVDTSTTYTPTSP